MVDYQWANDIVTIRERERGYVHMQNSENGEMVLGLYSTISVFLDVRFSVVVFQ